MMCAYACAAVHCGGQRAFLRSWFSPGPFRRMFSPTSHLPRPSLYRFKPPSILMSCSHQRDSATVVKLTCELLTFKGKCSREGEKGSCGCQAGCQASLLWSLLAKLPSTDLVQAPTSLCSTVTKQGYSTFWHQKVTLRFINVMGLHSQLSGYTRPSGCKLGLKADIVSLLFVLRQILTL